MTREVDRWGGGTRELYRWGGGTREVDRWGGGTRGGQVDNRSVTVGWVDKRGGHGVGDKRG